DQALGLVGDHFLDAATRAPSLQNVAPILGAQRAFGLPRNYVNLVNLRVVLGDQRDVVGDLPHPLQRRVHHDLDRPLCFLIHRMLLPAARARGPGDTPPVGLRGDHDCDSYYHMKAAITSAQQAGGLRQLKKLEAMRHGQLTAFGLFEAHGCDAVTIEEVASAARVSAPTIYRHFGTKEGLVLWDEYDPVLLSALAERLRVDALGDAIREAIVRPLDRIYAAE